MRNAVSFVVARFSADQLLMSLTKCRTNYRVSKLSTELSFFVTKRTCRPVSTLLRTAIFMFFYLFPMGDVLQVSDSFALATLLSQFRLLVISTLSGNFC
jgi:hypothetical protein